MLLLLVVGLGAATLVMRLASGGQSEVLRERNTALAMGLAKEALIGFASQYGRLPRPARSATDGLEAPQPCTDEASCTGFLPWATLGVQRSDGWGHLLRYSVTPVFTTAPLDLHESVATKTVSGRRDGQLYYLVGNAECQRAAQCAPAVLLSTGRRNFGFSEAGIAQANESDANPDEALNARASTAFIARTMTTDSQAPGGEFDDIVTWLPRLPLVARISATAP